MSSLFRYMIFILIFLTIAVIVWLAFRTPKNDRNWMDILDRQSQFIESSPGVYDLRNLRAFEYGPDGQFMRKEWLETTVRMDAVSEVWFMVVPFEGNGNFAHTFLTFGFDTDEGPKRYLSVSVEARREVGEDYSAFGGLLRSYELSYIWMTEKDDLTTTHLDLGRDMRGYRLDISKDVAKNILARMIARTNDLTTTPRFYNTLTSNCTNELAKAVNQAHPGAIKFNTAWIFTGNADRKLYEAGFITDPAGDFETLREKSFMQDLIARHAALPAQEFSLAWREDFDARFDGSLDPDNVAAEPAID